MRSKGLDYEIAFNNEHHYKANAKEVIKLLESFFCNKRHPYLLEFKKLQNSLVTSLNLYFLRDAGSCGIVLKSNHKHLCHRVLNQSNVTDEFFKFCKDNKKRKVWW